MANVVCLSLWRNDEKRRIRERVDHLLDKKGVTRWVWVVGDSDDCTEDILRASADVFPGVEVVRHDTGMNDARTPDEKLVRQSQTVTAGLAALDEADDFVLLHESDLISPVDIAGRFLKTILVETFRRNAVAGWVTLGERRERFYDTFAYRIDGRKFENDPPYHPGYKPDQLFEVDSFGSCFLAPAWVLQGATIERGGVVEMCAQMKAAGLSLWVDPSIHIVQPLDLWEASLYANV